MFNPRERNLETALLELYHTPTKLFTDIREDIILLASIGDSLSVRGLILLGRLYLQTDDFDSALIYAVRANSIEKTAETYGLLASIYSELHKSEDALKNIDLAIQLGDDTYANWHLKSVCLVCLSRMEEAITASIKMKQLFDAADPLLRAHPENSNIMLKHYTGLALANLVLRNYRQALHYTDCALKFRSNDIEANFIQAILLLHQRKNRESIRCCMQLLCLPEVANGIRTDIYRALGFAFLYNGDFVDAIGVLQQVFAHANDLSTAVGLYDAYINAEQFANADALLKQSTQDLGILTTQAPTLFNRLRTNSYVIVYIWNPKHDSSAAHRDEDYGHAAMKVVHNGNSYYFSWFPSGDHYQNQSGIPRHTPSSYGEKSKITNKENATTKISALFGGILPSNVQMIEEHLMARQSDKEELRKSATFKIHFSKGLDFDRLLSWWQRLLGSNIPYDCNTLNCCDVILYALQSALDPSILGLNEIKTSKMMPKIWDKSPADPILGAYRYYLPRSEGSKSIAIYQYCYLLGKAINEFYKDMLPPTIIRHNRWNKKLRKIIKFDFDPVKFNPNWMTRTTKMRTEDIYTNLINQLVSETVFEYFDTD